MSQEYSSVDYHSIDSGADILVGRPYGYTEEYVVTEQVQTGVKTVGCGYAYETNHDPADRTYYVYGTTIKGDRGSSNWETSMARAMSVAGLKGQCPRRKSFTQAQGYVYNQTYAPCYDGYWGYWPDVPMSCSYIEGGKTDHGGTYDQVPVYKTVNTTKTRTTTYDKQSGLFSFGIGVPYPALNKALFSTRSEIVPAGHCVSADQIQ